MSAVITVVASYHAHGYCAIVESGRGFGEPPPDTGAGARRRRGHLGLVGGGVLGALQARCQRPDLARDLAAVRGAGVPAPGDRAARAGRHRLRAVPGRACFGWIEERALTGTTFADLPFSLVWTALAWHAVVTVLVGWWWLPRRLAAGTRSGLVGCALVGLVWGCGR